MALGAMEKYGCPVTIVPAGFNYYHPEKFRSKVILEFGQPYVITQEMVDLYKTDKKKAFSQMLDHLKNVYFFLLSYCKKLLQLDTHSISSRLCSSAGNFIQENQNKESQVLNKWCNWTEGLH